MSDNFQIPSIEEVFKSMDKLFDIIDLLDENYDKYDNNYLMRQFRSRGFTLKEIFLTDMLDWLCFLGWGDGNIDESEVNFINAILNLNLNEEDVLDIVDELNVERLTTLPLTFAIFIEYQTACNPDIDANIVEALFSLFFAAGSYLIVCDGVIDEKEIKGLRAYMSSLRRNIDSFDLDSIHE